MKNIIQFILIAIFAGTLLGCYTTRHRSAAFGYSNSDMLAYNGGNSHYNTEERKILFSAHLFIKVDNPDSTNKQIEKIAKKYGGYVNQLGTRESIIRVKSENINKAVIEISGLGKLQSKTMLGQDVTEEYLDYKIRLENAEKARKRYLELLARAENVTAALKVEKELERLNEVIDLLKGKMNRINHLSEYSTITIEIEEKKKPGILGYIGIGLYHSVKWLFVRN